MDERFYLLIEYARLYNFNPEETKDYMIEHYGHNHICDIETEELRNLISKLRFLVLTVQDREDLAKNPVYDYLFH